MSSIRRKFGVINGGAGQLAPTDRQAQLSQREAEKERSRRDAIEPLVKIYETPFRTRFPRVLADRTSVRNWGEAIAWCARRSDRSITGIQRLWIRYRHSGPESLARRKRSDKGSSRFFSQYPGAALFALSLIVQPGATFSSVHREIAQNAEALGIPLESIPSYETVRQWLKSKHTDLPKVFGNN